VIIEKKTQSLDSTYLRRERRIVFRIKIKKRELLTHIFDKKNGNDNFTLCVFSFCPSAFCQSDSDNQSHFYGKMRLFANEREILADGSCWPRCCRRSLGCLGDVETEYHSHEHVRKEEEKVKCSQIKPGGKTRGCFLFFRTTLQMKNRMNETDETQKNKQSTSIKENKKLQNQRSISFFLRSIHK
jgi:hypothetical protein